MLPALVTALRRAPALRSVARALLGPAVTWQARAWGSGAGLCGPAAHSQRPAEGPRASLALQRWSSAQCSGLTRSRRRTETRLGEPPPSGNLAIVGSVWSGQQAQRSRQQAGSGPLWSLSAAGAVSDTPSARARPCQPCEGLPRPASRAARSRAACHGERRGARGGCRAP